MATPPLSRELALEAVEAVAEHGSQTAAAAALGLSRATLQSRIQAAARYDIHALPRAIPAEGFEITRETLILGPEGQIKSRSLRTSPERGPAYELLPGHIVKGESALVDAEGRVTAKWVKTHLEASAAIDAMKAVAAALTERLPRAEAVRIPNAANGDLLNLFAVTDLHFGMLSWREETGADYDIGIAEKLLTDWFSAAIELAPNAHTAVLAQLGDLLHHDGHESVTPAHRNVLDADSRLQKVIRVVIQNGQIIYDLHLG